MVCTNTEASIAHLGHLIRHRLGKELLVGIWSKHTFRFYRRAQEAIIFIPAFLVRELVDDLVIVFVVIIRAEKTEPFFC